MVAFTDPHAPRELRILRALEYLQLVCSRAGQGPTRELYEQLAERYEVTRDELATALADWGMGRR